MKRDFAPFLDFEKYRKLVVETPVEPAAFNCKTPQQKEDQIQIRSIATGIAAGVSKLSDAEIVQAVQAGHRSGSELMMRRFNRVLCRVTRSIVNVDNEVAYHAAVMDALTRP